MDELRAVLHEIQVALREQSRGLSDLASAAARLAEIQTVLREQSREISGLSDGVMRLVRAIEQEDRLRDRLDRAEEKERDDRHEQLERALDDLRTRIESIGAGNRDLPARLSEAVAARLAAESLPPLPSYHDPDGPPSGRYKQLPPHSQPLELPAPDRESTGVFAREHVDGSPREVRDIVGGAVLFLWRKGVKWVAAVGGGTGLWHLLHKLGIL